MVGTGDVTVYRPRPGANFAKSYFFATLHFSERSDGGSTVLKLETITNPP